MPLFICYIISIYYTHTVHIDNTNKNVKESVLWPRVLQWKIYYYSLGGQLSTTCTNATEVAQWVAPSCSRQHPATDNDSETVNRIQWSSPPSLMF